MALSQAPARTASRPSVTPATVAAYLDSSDKHTQVDAARFFGCSERTIRNRLAEYRQQPTAAQEQPQRRTQRLHRISPPHRAYARPAPLVARLEAHRFVPIAPHLTAGPHASWVAWDGELRPVVPGTTGTAWNAEQKRLQQTALSKRQQWRMPEPDPAMRVPDVPLVERVLPEATTETQPLPIRAAVHNALPTITPSVKHYPPRPASPRSLDMSQLLDLAMYMVGPIPLIAWIIFALALLMLGMH